MEEIQLRLLARKELGVRQPGAIVLGSVARDRHGRIDGLLERRAKNPKPCPRRTRGRSPKYAHADGAVAVVLDGVGLPLRTVTVRP